MRIIIGVALLFLTTLLGAQAPPEAKDYFAIQVVDARTGRGVPLVELTTVNTILYVTDSNGLAAFYEPGLMGRKVFFHVRSHGYDFPKDGFGNRGRALETTPGGQGTLVASFPSITGLESVTGTCNTGLSPSPFCCAAGKCECSATAQNALIKTA